MGIRLSEKHGVNPAIPKFVWGGDDKNEIILAGRLPHDAEAPRGVVWNMEPCDNCKKYMQQGVIFISVEKGAEGNSPVRTGHMVVIKDDAVRRCVSPASLAEQIIKARFSFVPDDAWDQLGLPRGPVKSV